MSGAECVQWNADGSYTPFCVPCRYVGANVWTHSQAVARVRAHRASATHRRVARECFVCGRWIGPDEKALTVGEGTRHRYSC